MFEDSSWYLLANFIYYQLLFQFLFMKKEFQKKTPITYYGGKQKMVKEILPLIPPHEIYVEPFCGGAAVFWAKEPVRNETLNDLNGEVSNFYKVLKTDFSALQELVQVTMHSRQEYQDALVIYKHPHLFDELKRAWAF